MGLNADSAELLDMQELSMLVCQDRVAVGPWREVLGIENPSLVSTVPPGGQGDGSGTTPPSGNPVPDLEPSIPLPEHEPSISLPSMSSTTLPEIPTTASDDEMVQSKADIDGLSGDVEMSAPISTAPTVPRSTTGGKSLELLKATGLLKRKRVVLKLPQKENVEEDEDTRSSGDSTDDMEVDIIYVSKEKPKSRKKRRIVSTAMVESDVEQKPKRTERQRADGWQTVDSEGRCGPCEDAGANCKSFVQRSRGFRRYACCRCHDMKRMCSFARERRQALAANRLLGAKDAKETTRKNSSGNSKGSKGQGRGQETSQRRTRSQPPRGKKRMVEESSSDEEEEEEEQEARRPRGNKGKQKAKDREGSVTREVKMEEEDDDLDWLDGAYLLPSVLSNSGLLQWRQILPDHLLV